MKAVSEKKLIDTALARYKEWKAENDKKLEIRDKERLQKFHKSLERILEVPVKPRKLEFELGNFKILPAGVTGVRLQAEKICPRCKESIKTEQLHDLADIGCLLIGDGWRKHSCKKGKSRKQTAGEEALDLFCRILDILGVPTE